MSKEWELVNFCENDKYATKAYCAIHDVDESKNLGDITQIDEKDLSDFTMICGGSPCQSFSIAGNKRGGQYTCRSCGYDYNPLTIHFSKRGVCPKCGSTEIEKTRSSLLIEWLRIIREKKPIWGIYENVKNIVGNQFKQTFEMFVKELEEYGYNCYWKVLNASDYGIPQNRERLYMIIILKEYDNGKFCFPDSFELTKIMSDCLEEEVEDKYYIDNPSSRKLISKMVSEGKIPNRKVSRTIRGGGQASCDEKHSWDIVFVKKRKK